jgi:hypothetical protein
MSVPDPQTEPVEFYRYAKRRQAHGLGVLAAPCDHRIPQERHVEMLRLRLVEGLTLREIGERYGVTGASVREALGRYFRVAGARFRAHGGLIVTAPARFVDVLREAVVVMFARAAGAIEDDGRDPSDGIDPGLLEPFDAYRALLEVVGWERTVPAAPVQVNVSAHRWALESALGEYLSLQRYLMQVPATPAGVGQRDRAQRKVEQIEAFLASCGREHDTTPEGEA